MSEAQKISYIRIVPSEILFQLAEDCFWKNNNTNNFLNLTRISLLKRRWLTKRWSTSRIILKYKLIPWYFGARGIDVLVQQLWNSFRGYSCDIGYMYRLWRHGTSGTAPSGILVNECQLPWRIRMMKTC